MTKRKTVGLALGSGGIRGLAHVGVIKTFLKHNIPIDYIAGSSIGAWVGAHFSLFQDEAALEEATVGRQKEKLRAFLEPTMRGGLIKGEKMERLLHTWLEGKDFTDTKIPFAAVATDLITGSPVILQTGPLSAALRGSMSIPSLFAPFSYQNALLVDGGVSQPVPDEVVRHMGADIVISINLDNYIKNEQFSEEKKHSLRYISARSLSIMRYHLTQYSLTHSDIIIEPFIASSGSYRFMDYFTEKIDGNIIVNTGAEVTEKSIGAIQDLLETSTVSVY